MRVSHLSLVDFRNYATAELALAAGPNLILGRNGQGKTNLVEAIGYFSSLKSHRVSNDAPLIRAGKETAHALMRVEADLRSVVLELTINRERQNKASINRNPARPRELTRWFTSISFVPEDLSIVRGDPSARRRFLDEALAMRHPAAASILIDYERVLRQRTALLKSARRNASLLDRSGIEVWDEQLVSLGSQIMMARRDLVSDLSGPLSERYLHLVGVDHHPELHMIESVCATKSVSRETITESQPHEGVSRETLEASFREAILSVRPKELDRGVTLVGPHRDDLLLSLNNLPVKGYASHGESWSFIISLKVALASVLRDESPAGDPVIILDDVFAELDATRREKLMDAVSGFEQVIVTAAVEEDVPSTGRWNRIRVVSGTVSEPPTEGSDGQSG